TQAPLLVSVDSEPIDLPAHLTLDRSAFYLHTPQRRLLVYVKPALQTVHESYSHMNTLLAYRSILLVTVSAPLSTSGLTLIAVHLDDVRFRSTSFQSVRSSVQS